MDRSASRWNAWQQLVLSRQFSPALWCLINLYVNVMEYFKREWAFGCRWPATKSTHDFSLEAQLLHFKPIRCAMSSCAWMLSLTISDITHLWKHLKNKKSKCNLQTNSSKLQSYFWQLELCHCEKANETKIIFAVYFFPHQFVGKIDDLVVIIPSALCKRFKRVEQNKNATKNCVKDFLD